MESVAELTSNPSSDCASVIVPPAERPDLAVADKLLILGAARSGTSWLGKAFDSHPGVIYRYEPDMAFPREGPPHISNLVDFGRFAEDAVVFVQKMATVRTLRSVGSLPMHRKSYHSASGHWLRLCLIGALRAFEKSGLPGRIAARNLEIPDFVELGAARIPMIVIKSINFVDRAGLFARTVPGLRVILLLRDPRSVIASRLRGLRAGKFAADDPWEGLVELEPASRRGLTIEQFRRSPRAVQMAWDWLTVNETAMEGLDRFNNSRIVTYREVVSAPEPTMRGLFDFAGLPWSAQTEKFIAGSRSRSGRGRYYGVYREKNFERRAHRWEDVLSAAEAQQIRDIVKDSAPGQLLM